MSRTALEPAWILHRRPYRDTSLLLELFTASFGRVGLVARGARSARSKTRSLLQPFQPLLVSWSGRGELGTLASVEASHAAPRLPCNRLMAGFYVNELLLKLLERNDAQTTLFSRYATVVEAIARAADETALAAALRVFEKRLLEELGYGLILTHEANSERPVDAHTLYHYEAELGPVASGVREPTRPLISGAALRALAEERLESAEDLRSARVLLQETINRLLGGRRLQTSEVARAAVAAVRRGGNGETSAAVPPEVAGAPALGAGGVTGVRAAGSSATDEGS